MTRDEAISTIYGLCVASIKSNDNAVLEATVNALTAGTVLVKDFFDLQERQALALENIAAELAQLRAHLVR